MAANGPTLRARFLLRVARRRVLRDLVGTGSFGSGAGRTPRSGGQGESMRNHLPTTLLST